MLNVKKHICFFFLIFLEAILGAQTYNFKNYSTEQGLPQSQVLSIFQDHTGNMWFGTNSGGVGKYDGSKFTTISDNEGLINNVVFSIIENSKNQMVFGTSRGITVYNGFTYKNYNEKNGLKNSWVFKLLSDGGKVWIGTQQGVYILQNEKIEPFKLDAILAQASVFSIFIDSQERIWFATINNGAICYNAKTNSFLHFNKKNGLQENFVFSIAETAENEILLGINGGIHIVDIKNNLKVCDYIQRQFYVSFRSILVSSKNEQWLGTDDNGLHRYDNGKQKRFNTSNGLTFNSIMSLWEDREHNIWIGTDGSGVYKYSGDRFLFYSKQNGLPENYINAVSQDKEGNYWLAMRNHGVCKVNGTEIKTYNANDKKQKTLPDNNVSSILQLKDGRMLFGTFEGLSIYENEKFRTVTQHGFAKQYILSLCQDSESVVWIGTNDGLFTYQDNVITDIKIVNKLKTPGIIFSIFCTIEDKNKNIWVGTENGLLCYDGKGVSKFNQHTNFFNCRVTSAVMDSKKNIWFGTDEGVYFYNYKSFFRISKANGLSSNFVNFLQVDDLNRLIVGTNTGIDILDFGLFYKDKIAITHLGKHDDLISLESNFNAGYKDDEGRILIGTINGLEIYNPKFDVKNEKEAVTHINHVKLFFGQEDLGKYTTLTDSTTLLPKNLKLPFNRNHLTFQFIGISLTAPEKDMYQYKLEGLDNNWTPPSFKTEATYSSLPPGKYKFLVKAMNNDGLWNKDAVTYEFTISPPWYNTWWFYAICGITLITCIWLYNFTHTNKLIADKQKLEQTVDERTLELRKEKEKVEIINKEVIEQKTLIEHHNIEIMDSIKYAKNIQEALLPNLNEINNLFKQCFVLYMPKDIVSGDFYWFAYNGITRFIAAVDCTGHGVPGAFMSIVGNTLLNEIVNEKKITVPSDILLELHKGVKIALNQNAREFERRDGMDITLCTFNSRLNEVQYAGANRPLWIYRKDKAYELEIIKPTKFAIGGLELQENRTYQNHTIKVSDGDCLYLFTDGYADQFGGPQGKKFMLTRLQKTIFESVDKPMTLQKQNLTNTFIEWKQDGEQIDDVLVIGIKI